MSTFDNVLDRLIPDTRKELSLMVDQIEKKAIDNWPVRRTPTGRISKKSKNSKGKMYSEVIVTTDFNVVARVGNDAPYSWAIKVGARTLIDMPLGRRISTELLWKPMRKKTDSVIETLKNETVKLMLK